MQLLTNHIKMKKEYITFILIAQLEGEEQWGKIKDEIIRQAGMMYRDHDKGIKNGLVYNKLFSTEEKTHLQLAVESLEDKQSNEKIMLVFIELDNNFDSDHNYLSAKAYGD